MISDLNEATGTVRSRHEQMKGLEDHKARLIVERGGKKDEFLILDEGLIVVDELIRKVSERDLGVLTDLINWGLDLVFDDRTYIVVIAVVRQRSTQTLKFRLVETLHGKEVVSDIHTDVGGGVRAVISLLIQVFYLKFSDLARFILIDESLSAVSDQYIEGLFHLLRTLIDRMGFRFILITHDERFLRMVDHHYVVQRGEYKLTRT